MNANPSDNAVLDVRDVSRQYGTKRPLDTVTLSIERGLLFGLLAGNGAGNTTLINRILGLLRPQSGSGRVFGLDPVAQPAAVLARIGYLSENRDLPGWMRVDELLRYTRAFYKSWDADYA